MSSVARIRWLPTLPYVLAGYALRLLVGMIAAHPFVALVKRTLGGWPSGDRMVFDSGGLMLAEVVRLHGPALWGQLEQSALILLAMLPVGMIASALLLSALASDTPRCVHSVTVTAAARFVPVAAITLVQVVGAVGGIFAAFVVREGVTSALQASFSPRMSDLLSVVVLLLGGTLASVVVVVTDTARASAVHVGLDTAQALVRGISTFAGSPWPLCVAFASRASAALFVAVVAVTVSLWTGFGSPSRALAVVGLQQVALITMACLRASWLARAMALSKSVPTNGADSYRSARSGERSDPNRDRDS